MTFIELLDRRDPESYVLLINGNQVVGSSVTYFKGKNFSHLRDRNVIEKKDGVVEILR